METTLPPLIKLKPRYVTLAVLMLLVMVTPHAQWWMQLIGFAMLLTLVGTYRVSSLDGDKFTTQLFFAFIPLKPMKCNLPGVIYVETKYNNTGANLGTFFLFGPVQWAFSYVFDMLLPVFGGAFEIWLITAKGREIPAWQGFSQQHFESNLQLLTSRTGAEVRGRSL